MPTVKPPDVAFRSRLMGHAAQYVIADFWAEGGKASNWHEHLDTWDSRHTNEEVVTFLAEKGGLVSFFKIYPLYFDPDKYGKFLR